MQTMTEDRTDERIARLEERVEQGFEQVDQRFEQVDKQFKAVDKRFEKLEDKLESLQKEMNQRFEGIHRNMFHGLLVLCGVMMTGFVGVMGMIITQV